MRWRHFLTHISTTIVLLTGGCSYRFCNIGPTCRVEHIFLPKPFTLATTLSDERLSNRPLQAKFGFTTVDYQGLTLTTYLDTSNALTHEHLGQYVFPTSTTTYSVKLTNIPLPSKPAFPHDQVPLPQQVYFCLTDTNYGFGDAILTVNGKAFESNLSSSDTCAIFPANDLGAWIDCGDGCPPTATLP